MHTGQYPAFHAEPTAFATGMPVADDSVDPSPGSRRPLLIVEDDPALLAQMRWMFNDAPVLAAATADEALRKMANDAPAVVTMDLGLPPFPDGVEAGFALLADILAAAPHTKVIVLTGQDDHANALRAIQMGAHDFYAKPVQPELLALTIDRAFRVAELQEENRRLAAAEAATPMGFRRIVTQDPAMLAIGRTLDKVAGTTATVLIHGESGTGKELVARAVHDSSPRRDGRWMALNCAAIPEALLESELFGYEKGAFTGAARQTPGKVELADGGTLFLDEIGDLSPALQAKLLRFLQERVIERVGGREEIPVDVRIVCATHRDLRAMIRAGTFREDLFFRLAEIVIEVPPLRERPGDVLLLARTLLHRMAAAGGRAAPVLSPAAADAITRHRWPGNVRELENCLKRAFIMADGEQIQREDLGLPKELSDADLNLRQIRDVAEKQAVSRVLGRENGNLTRAARVLGISRPTLYDLIERFGLRPPLAGKA